jgi:hypothetical protein
LTSDLVFWTALAFQVLIIGTFDVTWKGWWIPLVTQTIIAWALRHQGRILQCRFSVLLDDVARDWQLTPTSKSPAAPEPRPATG